MDEEQTGGYSEPCGQCSAVDWGISDEGRFYCKSCHNVIERTREVVDAGTLFVGSSRVSSISKETRRKKLEHGREWMVCEGFQFILKHQAEALVKIGVCPHFKDDVLLNFWRMYLQKSRQAYTSNPVRTTKFKVVSIPLLGHHESLPSPGFNSSLRPCLSCQSYLSYIVKHKNYLKIP